MSEVREETWINLWDRQLPCVATVWDLLMGQVATANNTVVETIDVITEEWRKIADQGVTQAELMPRKNTYGCLSIAI